MINKLSGIFLSPCHFVICGSMKMFGVGSLILCSSCIWFQVSTARKAALSNKHLIVAAEPWPPFLVMKKDINGKATYSGFSWELMKFIQRARNCTFTIKRPYDGQWGYCFGDNNCTGMIGLVNRKEADFAIGLL